MAFAFTSVTVKVNDSILKGCGPYSFRMHGALYHKLGALHPLDGCCPYYSQLYIYDQQAALAACNYCNPNLDHVLMGELQDMLNANNPLVPLYKQGYEIMHDSPPKLQQNLQ